MCASDCVFSVRYQANFTRLTQTPAAGAQRARPTEEGQRFCSCRGQLPTDGGENALDKILAQGSEVEVIEEMGTQLPRSANPHLRFKRIRTDGHAYYAMSIMDNVFNIFVKYS